MLRTRLRMERDRVFLYVIGNCSYVENSIRGSQCNEQKQTTTIMAMHSSAAYCCADCSCLQKYNERECKEYRDIEYGYDR